MGDIKALEGPACSLLSCPCSSPSAITLLFISTEGMGVGVGGGNNDNFLCSFERHEIRSGEHDCKSSSPPHLEGVQVSTF